MSIKYQIFFLFFLILSLGLFSCSKKIDDAIVKRAGDYDLPSRDDSLSIHFLGTASFWINYNGRAILTDPFVSNPPLRKVMFRSIYPSDTSIVNDFISPDELEQVEMVVIGHAHYDHLLDLPHMINYIPSSAKIVGSTTANYIISSSCIDHEQVAANNYAATNHSFGKWIYNSDSLMRIMPITADHPPHLMGITLYGGNYYEDLKAIPRKSRGWKMGKPFAYLMDFLREDGSIGYRIFFQSSGSEYPLGFFPEEMLDGRTVDIAILSIATDSPYEEFPDKILLLIKPKVIFLAHWENFWRNKYKSVKTVQKGDPEQLYFHLKEKFGKDTEIILPLPGGTFRMH